MTRALAIQSGIAGAAGLVGLLLLRAPGRGRRLLRLPDTDASAYILRMTGAMLAALGLFLGGFAVMFHLASIA